MDPVTARSVSGASVTLGVAGSTSTTVTSADGQFEVAVPAPRAGDTEYSLAIDPPADSAFVALRLMCPVSTVRGSGCPLGLVNSRPYFPDIAEISYRGSRDVIVPGAPVRFTRLGGVDIYGKGVVNDVVATRTDGSGRLQLFGLEIHTTEIGEVVGRLMVVLPPPLDSGWVDTVHLASALFFREPRPLLLFQVGPSVGHTYGFRVGSSAPAKGVAVRLTRISGVEAIPDTVSGVTDSTGSVRLNLRPLQRGSMTAMLTVTPPAPYLPFTVSNVVLRTREDDKSPVFGVWDVTNGQALSVRGRGAW